MILENPKYKEMISKYPHLKGLEMEDGNNKPMLSMQLILGTSKYARIKDKQTKDTVPGRAHCRENKVRMDGDVPRTRGQPKQHVPDSDFGCRLQGPMQI